MKAKKSIKKITTIVTILAVLFCAAIPASAATPQETETVASYDRTIGGTQVFHLTDENGEECVITVTEVPSTGRITNGTYEIKHEKKGYWLAGFKVTVSNNTITSAHGSYASPYIGSITNRTLQIDNLKQASYRFLHKYLFLEDSTGIKCVAEKDSIKISIL